MEIKKIEEGSGVEFTIILNGVREKFNLCIVKRKDHIWGGEKHELVFINERKDKIVDSVYSGGNTGFGVHNYSVVDMPQDYEFVTAHLDIINCTAEKLEKEEEVAAAKRMENMVRKTKEINDLPETFTTGVDLIDKQFHFTRGLAIYNPPYSAAIHGGEVYFRSISGNGRYFYLPEYITKDGKLRTQKFAKGSLYREICDAVPEVKFQMDPKLLLEILVAKDREIKSKIKKIKVG